MEIDFSNDMYDHTLSKDEVAAIKMHVKNKLSHLDKNETDNLLVNVKQIATDDSLNITVLNKTTGKIDRGLTDLVKFV